MHYHCEIIMPPTDDVEQSLADILAPFSEHNEEGYRAAFWGRAAFWDWYEIGGRWAGGKLTQALDEKTLVAFYNELKENKVTVSSVIAGKQKLTPASQAPLVDLIWKKHFPDTSFVACPMFSDAGDHLPGDIQPFSEVSLEVTAHRVIFAQKSTWADDRPEAMFMLSIEAWNGCNYERTNWDGTLRQALTLLEGHYNKLTPAPD